MVSMRHLLLPAGLLACFSSAAYIPGKAFNRFITIWLENEDFFKTSENPGLVALSSQGIRLTSFYGVTHPSQPNYIASVGGDYFGLNDDGLVEIPENVSTLVDLFEDKGIAWKEYVGNTPSPGFIGISASEDDGGTSIDFYKHNPLISYKSVSGNSSRLANIQSLEEFETDRRERTLPQWAHMSPSMLNYGPNSSLESTLNWSHTFLEPLLTDSYFMEDTLVLLTYDEAETYGKPNKVASILLGGAVPEALRNTTDDTYYTHYSALATLENNWGLPNLGRYDVGANVFAAVTNKTGYQNLEVDRSHILLNESYPGPLNIKKDRQIPFPRPNVALAGAGGSILKIVKDTWSSAINLSTPYAGYPQAFDFFHPPVYIESGEKPTASFGKVREVPATGALLVVIFAAMVFL